MRAPEKDAWRRRSALLMMLASGFAGLGYQIVWTQQCALWLGHEAAAVLAVLAAFFGGLAAGALLLSNRIARSHRPGRWYAASEVVIALWGAALLVLMAPFSSWLLGITGAQPSPVWQWTVAFVGSFLILLPATAAMGATLPAIERIMASLHGRSQEQSQAIAALYASNTFGAVLGVLATAFWLLPSIGLKATAGVCVALNLACAATAWLSFNQHAATSEGSAPARATTPAPARRSLLLLLFTGLLGIGFEVMVVRVQSQVAEDTVYTFAMLLAVYLVGTAIGAAVYQRYWQTSADAPALTDRLLCALAAACLVGSLSLWGSEHLKDAVLHQVGASMAGALSAEAAMALLAFALPTLVMGALFSHLCVQARAQGQSFGRSLGINTLGAAAAPVLFGVWLAPTLGAKTVLLLIAAGYLLLVSRTAWRTPKVGGTAAAALVLGFWAPPLTFVDVPEDGRLLRYQEGAMGAVSVVQDGAGVKRLHINNRQQEGSSDAWFADARQAMLPLLLHAAPAQLLFLGVGSGVTSGAAAQSSNVRVDAVDLLPEVIAASAEFRSVYGDGQANPRLRLLSADARRFVRTTTARYDIIVSDNFHPARSGAGALCTVEHFAAVRSRLAEGGLFCQWLPLHQMDLTTLRSIVRAFLAVYPQAGAMLATNSLQTPVLGLVARVDDKAFDGDAAPARIGQAAPALRLDELELTDTWSLLGSFVAGPQALARFAGDAPLNTDDRPVVAYQAPRMTYAPDSLPRDRLIALLASLPQASNDSAVRFGDPTLQSRLLAYQQARNQFIAAGRDVRPVADPARMLAQVREPLLAVLRTSPDFQPAYQPLLRLAQALAPTDAVQAQRLLEELQRLQPAR
jgi:spermidine synthase